MMKAKCTYEEINAIKLHLTATKPEQNFTFLLLDSFKFRWFFKDFSKNGIEISIFKLKSIADNKIDS